MSLLIDTFQQGRPMKPFDCHQVWILHSRFMDHVSAYYMIFFHQFFIKKNATDIYVKIKGVACLIVLMNKRTGLLYSAVFAKLKELCPNLEANIDFIMGDLERAPMLAAREHFPHAKINACWFHFCKVLKIKKIKKFITFRNFGGKRVF